MIIFLLWNMAGIVVVSIKGKSYTYQVDAAMIPEWQRRAARTPGRVFNEVKRLGTLVIEPREDSENTRCSLSSLNADTVLQRKDNTMTKAMNWKDLRSSYLSVGYNVINGEKNAKGHAYPKKYRCPDCYAVYAKRAGKADIPAAAYTKIMVFTKEGKPPVGACPCGYRKCGDKTQHSAQYLNEFGDVSPTPPAAPVTATAVVDKCKALTKAGKPCCNKATVSGYCKTHTATVNKGF